MVVYELAIRVDDFNRVGKLLEELTKMSVASLWFKELKKKSKMVHYHGRLHIKSNLKMESVKKTFRSLLRNTYSKLKMVNPWWVADIKDQFKYNRYIAKENDMVKKYTNFPESEIAKIIESVEMLNIEKKIPMKDQLLAGYTSDDEPGVIRYIINYHSARNYLPPNITLLKQYAMYIELALGADPLAVVEKYYSQLDNLPEIVNFQGEKLGFPINMPEFIN